MLLSHSPARGCCMACFMETLSQKCSSELNNTGTETPFMFVVFSSWLPSLKQSLQRGLAALHPASSTICTSVWLQVFRCCLWIIKMSFHAHEEKRHPLITSILPGTIPTWHTNGYCNAISLHPVSIRRDRQAKNKNWNEIVRISTNPCHYCMFMPCHKPAEKV